MVLVVTFLQPFCNLCFDCNFFINKLHDIKHLVKEMGLHNEVKNNTVVVSSLQIAEHFDKEHKNVLRLLNALLRSANKQRLSKHFFEDTLELFYKIYNKKALAPPYLASQCLYFISYLSYLRRVFLLSINKGRLFNHSSNSNCALAYFAEFLL